MMIIYLARRSGRLRRFGGHRPPLQHRMVRRYPGIIGGPAVLPLFVLHRMGFFLPRPLLAER